MELKLTKPLIFFDLETTGVNVLRDRIVEMTILKAYPDKEPVCKTFRFRPVDDNGNTLVVRTSNYANFKDDILPSGKVDVVGVMTMYATTWQLYLRDRNDVTAAQ